jgi:hypothetical protein
MTSTSMPSSLVAAAATITLFLLLLVSSPAPAAADIFQFDAMQLTNGTLIGRRVAMHSPSDTPSKGPPGDGMSYISADLEFTMPKAVTGDVQVVIMEASTLDGVGVLLDGEPVLCCSEELMARYTPIPGCTTPRQLIIDPSQNVLHTTKVHFANSKTAKLHPGAKGTYNVLTRGQHLLIVSNCDPALKGMAMKGAGVWMNPYGYLPGELYGYLPFYFAMSIIFFLFAVVWLALNVYHRAEVHTVQNYISFVIVMSLLEMCVWYFDYLNFNRTGVRHPVVVITAIFMSVFRRTFSRMLLVSVSLGFGVVRPTLGSSKRKIILLGIAYFISEAAMELTIRYGQTNEVGQHWRLFLSIPVAGLNAIVYWWTFVALYEVTAYLKGRRQDTKLKLYETFTGWLFVSLAAALAFACYQIYFMTSHQMLVHWDLLWLLEGGFWEMLYFCMLLSIAWLWKPSTDSKRYAYMQVIPTEDEDFTLEMGPESGADRGQEEEGEGTQYGMDEPDSSIFTIDDEEDDDDDGPV